MQVGVLSGGREEKKMKAFCDDSRGGGRSRVWGGEVMKYEIVSRIGECKGKE